MKWLSPRLCAAGAQTCVVLICVVGTAAGPAVADPIENLAARVGVKVIASGTSDQRALKSASGRIPYRQMSARSRQRARTIVEQWSQYRRMPSLQYEVDPDIYLYLMRNPDAAVSTWRVMGISQLQMFQTGTFEYEAQAIDGSEGTADVLWRDHNQCLFIAEGRYNSPLLPASINASALVWLKFRFVRTDDGRTLVNQQVETFIHFPSAAIETIARMASRITNSILDRNVFEVSLYARMMSQAAERDPDWLSEVASRMDGVAAERRSELLALANRRGETQRPRQDADQLPPAKFANVFVRSASNPAQSVPPQQWRERGVQQPRLTMKAPLPPAISAGPPRPDRRLSAQMNAAVHPATLGRIKRQASERANAAAANGRSTRPANTNTVSSPVDRSAATTVATRTPVASGPVSRPQKPQPAAATNVEEAVESASSDQQLPDPGAVLLPPATEEIATEEGAIEAVVAEAVAAENAVVTNSDSDSDSDGATTTAADATAAADDSSADDSAEEE